MIQTEKPFWLDEAYDDAISVLDTGILARNTAIAKKLALLLYYLFGRNGRYLDIAGGYGLLTRHMRDIGFDFYWHDRYCKNIFAKGFEFEKNNEPYTAVTAFEVLEHIVDPVGFINENMEANNTDTFIFTTLLYKGDVPRPNQWWYYAHESGQHLTFYNSRTLGAIAKKLKLNIYSNNFFHILSKRTINKQILKFILGPLSEILVFLVYFKMSTRAMTDHEDLKKRFYKSRKDNLN